MVRLILEVLGYVIFTRLMKSDNSSLDLSGHALVLGDWLLLALGEGRCWLFGILTAREFGLLHSCHYSSVKKTAWKIRWPVEDSVTRPFGFELSQSHQIHLNSTKYNLSAWIIMCPFLCQSLSFLRIWMVHSERGELTLEIVNPLPEVWHQAFCCL